MKEEIWKTQTTIDGLWHGSMVMDVTFDEEEYYHVLEKSHKEQLIVGTHDLNSRLKELFPEGEQIIEEKIQDWQEVKLEILKSVKGRLEIIYRDMKNENQFEISKLFIKNYFETPYDEAIRHIARLRRELEQYLNGKTDGSKKEVNEHGLVSDREIDKARDVPIGVIAEQFTQLKNYSERMLGLCPLHIEKTPSFTIYKNTNSFYCFGCHQGGDVIELVKRLYNYSFPDAVRYLNDNF